MSLTEILLAAILIMQVLIWAQDNRIGRWIAKRFDKLVFNWRTRNL